MKLNLVMMATLLLGAGPRLAPPSPENHPASPPKGAPRLAENYSTENIGWERDPGRMLFSRSEPLFWGGGIKDFRPLSGKGFGVQALGQKSARSD